MKRRLNGAFLLTFLLQPDFCDMSDVIHNGRTSMYIDPAAILPPRHKLGFYTYIVNSLSVEALF